MLYSIPYSQLYSCNEVKNIQFFEDLQGSDDLSNPYCTQLLHDPNGNNSAKSIICFDNTNKRNTLTSKEICSIQMYRFKSSFFMSCMLDGVIEFTKQFDNIATEIYQSKGKGT